jgi:hypothetical protein
MGWAGTNIIAKFTLIFFIQRIKDNYWARDKMRSELKLRSIHPEHSLKHLDAEDMREKLADIEGQQTDLIYQEQQSLGQQMASVGAPKREKDGAEVHCSPSSNSMPSRKDVKEDCSDHSTADFDTASLEHKFDMLESRLMSKMEHMIERVGENLTQFQCISKQIEQSKESVREMTGCALQDLSKQNEKNLATCEVKMELGFAAQLEAQRKLQADRAEDMKAEGELRHKAAESHDLNLAVLEKMAEKLDGAFTQKLDEIQESHGSALSAVEQSLTTMTDQCTQQMISEVKAATFTLQTKIGVMEEIQGKNQLEVESRMTSKLQQVVHEGTCALKEQAEQQQASTQQLRSCVEASNTMMGGEHTRLHDAVASLKDMQADNAKHVEAGIGVFGNSLRAQIDSLTQAQLQQRMEAEKDIACNMDRLLSRIQGHSQEGAQENQKQAGRTMSALEANLKDCLEKVDQHHSGSIKEFQEYMETVVKTQHNRHQEMACMVNTVLEQACGAKTRAEAVADKLDVVSSTLMRAELQRAESRKEFASIENSSLRFMPPHDDGRSSYERGIDGQQGGSSASPRNAPPVRTRPASAFSGSGSRGMLPTAAVQMSPHAAGHAGRYAMSGMHMTNS